jgi:AraC-like DNA-binding protein
MNNTQNNLLSSQKFTTCLNCNDNNDQLIRVSNYKKDGTYRLNFDVNTIVLIVKGEGLFSLGMKIDKPIQKGDIFMCQGSQFCSLNAHEDVTLLQFRFNMNVDFCNKFSFEMLLGEKKYKKTLNDFYFLTSNETMKLYVETLLHNFEDGLNCSYFLEIKMKEFFYILRVYYSKEELKAFFRPVLNKDLEFSLFIFQNYQKVKSAKELAQMLGYSLSGFKKRFPRVFGTSYNQWVEAQKAKNVYHEIICTTKKFGQLRVEYGFSSPSHFNKFCRRYFNDAPSSLRKRYLEENVE